MLRRIKRLWLLKKKDASDRRIEELNQKIQKIEQEEKNLEARKQELKL